MGEKNGAVAFFDVDGTLVWHDFERMRKRAKGGTPTEAIQIRPSDAVYEAFSRMRAAGNLTFICTGRHLPFIPQTIRELNPDGFVAGAGAIVCVGDEVVRAEFIERDLLLETARRFVAAGIDITLEGDEDNIELHPSGRPARFPGSRLARTAEEVAEFSRERRYSKFCSNGVGERDLVPLRDFIDAHYTICDLQGGVLEFSMHGVDKGTGIEAALAHLGHGRGGTFAFGDSENDLSMRAAVETFVAMGNALPNVRAVADYVTLTAAEDGVPAALEHFGLI